MNTNIPHNVQYPHAPHTGESPINPLCTEFHDRMMQVEHQARQYSYHGAFWVIPTFLIAIIAPFAYARMEPATTHTIQYSQSSPAAFEAMHAAAPLEQESSSSAQETSSEITDENESAPSSVSSESISMASSSEASSSSSSTHVEVPLRVERKAGSVVGMYLTPNSMSREDYFVGTMEDTGLAGGNALVFDVKGSAVFFDADAPMAKELGLIQKKYDLPEVIKSAHERGIYVIGRFIAVKDAGFTRARPDTMIKHPKSGAKIGYEFIDPQNKDALQYNHEVLCALAKSGIDEVNLDYIRFSTEQVGALGIFTSEEKSARIGGFIKMAREAIDECGPKTKLGISTYAILGWNYDINVANLGQDVKTFAQYVDIISPMAYPATFAENAYYRPGIDKGSRMYFLVWRTLKGYKEMIGEENAYKIRPWIQGYGVTTKNMQDQMKAVTDAGLCGFTVWNADNAYGVAYKALKTWTQGAECTI